MLLWANAYAAKNRVEPKGLEGLAHQLEAKDIPLLCYLPSQEDSEVLQHSMTTLVSRILVKHVPHFQQYYKDVVTWHIPHPHSEESAMKSTLVESYFILDSMVKKPFSNHSSIPSSIIYLNFA